MANDPRDIDALTRTLSDLDVQLSQSADGVFTVCSTSEPLFCFDGDSKEEVSKLVVDTLVSYAKHFFHHDLTGGRTETQPLEETPIPVELSTPVSRLKPVFDLAA